jgi:hypothetical protein
VRTEIIYLGSAPFSEICALPGDASYEERSLIECCVLRRMLLRLYPIHDSSAAVLTIENRLHYPDFERQVCVRFRGPVGMHYAHALEHDLPRRWDALAREELSWYCKRRLFELLVERGLTDPRHVPEEFRCEEPSGRAREAGGDPHGGAGSRRNPASHDAGAAECAASAPATPASLILGPVATASAQHLALRFTPPVGKGSDVRVYTPDLARCVGPVSTPQRKASRC